MAGRSPFGVVGYVCSPRSLSRAARTANISLSGDADGILRREAGRVFQLIDYVPVGAQRFVRVVAELAGHVDHAAALVQQQRGKGVAQVVGGGVLDARRVE